MKAAIAVVMLFTLIGMWAPSHAQRPSSAARRTSSGSPEQEGDSDDSAVIGKLAVVSVDTNIYAQPEGSSRVRAKVSKGTYLAITKGGDRWSGVLMPDHGPAWVRTADIRALDYDVVSATAPGTSSTQGLQNERARRAILAEAYRFLGVPYRRNGASWAGIDSTHLVRHCFGVLGISMPAYLSAQMHTGMPVKASDLQMGDRLYFANRHGRLIDTGIYVGNGYFIHSYPRRGGVCVSRLDEPDISPMLAAARR